MTSDISLAPTDASGLRGALRRAGKRRLLLTLLAVGLGVGLWRAYAAFAPSGAPPSSARGGARGAVAVRTATVAYGDFPVVLSGLGTVTPSATSIVKPQVSGQLVEVNFREGDMVHAGDVLAEVDPRAYRNALAQAEGQLQKDESLLANAERDLARYVSLRQRIKDAVSSQQIDTQAALIAQYKATVAIDRAQVEQARLNLSYCRIVAPIDGRLGLRVVDQGNYVQPGDQGGVAVVTKVSPITVIFTLPAVKLPAVLQHFRAGEPLSVVAHDQTRTTELARGKLFAIDNQIDASTGTIRLRAEFPNADERLYPNQFVNVDLLVETLNHALLAPTTAVQYGARGPFAYVVTADNTVATRPLKLGVDSGDHVVVETGLAPDDKVVVEGADKLRDGMAVTTPEAAGERRHKGAGPS